MTAQSPQSVLILGTGLAGVSVAYHLSRQGYRVTLLGHPEWEDGFRTNASAAAPLLFGCHHETWGVLRALDRGMSSQPDSTIPLEFRLPEGAVVAYRSTYLPGALQWMMSLLGFHGLPWRDRWRLFSHLEQIWEQAQSPPAVLDSRIADEWLASIGQSQAARDRIWNPLAQWLTGNYLARLSAATFVQLLSFVFLGRAWDARLTYLNGSVGDRFITPITRALEERGVQIHVLTHRPDFRFGENAVSGLQLEDGTLLQAQWYVAALSHQKLLPLLPERLLTRYAYFAHLSELEALSEIAVQFSCRSTVRTPRLLLLTDRPFHQCTTTPLGPQEVRCRLSAIDNQALVALRDSQLIDLGRAELCALYPEVGTDRIRSMEVYRDDFAALSLRPGTALLRPLQQGPIQNLLVAGAWTDTRWPATVESTFVSARRCVEIITAHPA